MTELFVAAAAGAVIVFLGILAVSYGVRVRSALASANEAVKVANAALQAKQEAQASYAQLQAYVDAQNKRPMTIALTEEHLQFIAKNLGPLLLPYMSTMGRVS